MISISSTEVEVYNPVVLTCPQCKLESLPKVSFLNHPLKWIKMASGDYQISLTLNQAGDHQIQVEGQADFFVHVPRPSEGMFWPEFLVPVFLIIVLVAFFIRRAQQYRKALS